MLLEIRHETQYHYESPVRESVMELWMQPYRCTRQRLVNFELDITPVAQTFGYLDPCGNTVHTFDLPQPHDGLTIIARSVVETTPCDPLPDQLDMGEWHRLRSDRLQGDYFDFLKPHRFVETTDLLLRFIAENGLEGLRDRDPLTALRALNRAIHDNFAYKPGVTEADSPIDIALEAKRGVCQDFAHIMLAICRHWGLPARYVSGYLYSDKRRGDRSDPDATHAWVEVFLPSLHWVGFDPTNNMLTEDRHIAVAKGRDYGDVPPSRGVFKGEAASHLVVGVRVSEVRSSPLDNRELRMARPVFPPAQRRSGSWLLEQQQQQQQ